MAGFGYEEDPMEIFANREAPPGMGGVGGMGGIDPRVRFDVPWQQDAMPDPRMTGGGAGAEGGGGGGSFGMNPYLLMGLGILSNPGQSALTGISKGALQGMSMYEDMKDRASKREQEGLRTKDAKRKMDQRTALADKLARGETPDMADLQSMMAYDDPSSLYENMVKESQAKQEAEQTEQARQAGMAQIQGFADEPFTPEQQYGMVRASGATNRKDLDDAFSKVFTSPKPKEYDIREGGASGDPSQRQFYAFPKNDPFSAQPIGAIPPKQPKAMVEINDPYGLGKKEQIGKRDQISKLQGAREVTQELVDLLDSSNTLTGIPGMVRQTVGGLAGQISDVTGDSVSKAFRDSLEPEKVAMFQSLGTQIAARSKEFFAGEPGKLSKEDQKMVERALAILDKTTDKGIALSQAKTVLEAFDRAERRHAGELEEGLKTKFAKDPARRPPLGTLSRKEVEDDLGDIQGRPGYEDTTYEDVVDMLREKGYEVE